MRGSLVKLFVAGGVSTEWKKTSVFASMPPSFTPVLLLKLRMRPLIATMNWLGPAAPMESGGKEYSVSASVAPRKLMDATCGVIGAGCEPKPAGGHWMTLGESGLEGRFWKSGRRTRWDLRACWLAEVCRSRSMIS